MPESARAPIGVFDSGVGGLTVVRALRERLPHEPVVYLGDTARVPYGTKSPETVVRYARSCTRLLMERGIKLLVVACNTASAHALEILQNEVDIPVIGVVEPGARAAASATTSGHIGVIGTRGTIESGEYQRALERLRPTSTIFAKSCPLFVPLAEEGWTEGDVPEATARAYLAEFHTHNVDTLLLGCTHYPLLAGTIRNVMGECVEVVDSAHATAATIAEVIEALDVDPARSQSGGSLLKCLVTDAPKRFAETGQAFLGDAIQDVEWIDV